MNVVDSSAWLSYFAGDKNAGAFAKPIEAIEELLVPSITLTEVFKCIVRQRNEDVALEAIAHMEQGKVVSLDSALAVDAAVYGLKHKLPLADSIIYATAKMFDAVVWTQDADFKALPKVKYFQKVR
ncbi:PIN (PilT N terminus) domain [hydrothermal vent metagenome]|uniref:PIN (PilT N terminus) domain n=1 Tax=hydrothermal vent metagenome TaxID=652676 RepID=A0A3B0Z3Y5_9ZZZZ